MNEGERERVGVWDGLMNEGERERVGVWDGLMNEEVGGVVGWVDE